MNTHLRCARGCRKRNEQMTGLDWQDDPITRAHLCYFWFHSELLGCTFLSVCGEDHVDFNWYRHTILCTLLYNVAKPCPSSSSLSIFLSLTPISDYSFIDTKVLNHTGLIQRASLLLSSVLFFLYVAFIHVRFSAKIEYCTYRHDIVISPLYFPF